MIMKTFPIRRGRLFSAPLLLLMAAGPLAAQNDKSAVREVVDRIASALLLTDKGTRVLGAEIEDSLDGQTWRVQFLDPKFKSDRRLVEFRDDKVVSDDAKTLDDLQNTTPVALEASEMSQSPGNLRGRVHAAAKAAGVEPKSFRYVLFHPEDKSVARWYLYAYDTGHTMVGRMALNAQTSEVLAATWGADALTTAKTKKKARRSSGSGAESEFQEFGRDVERTFKGIGADLEQFFTGKRTVDK